MAILRTINLVTDVPDCHTKVFDDVAFAELRPDPLVQQLISDATWLWCVAELRDKPETFKTIGYVSVFDSGSCVVKADGVIFNAFLEKLRTEVEALASESCQTQEVYYHPHSPPSPSPPKDFPAHNLSVDGITIPDVDLEEVHYDEVAGYHSDDSWDVDNDSINVRMDIASDSLGIDGLEGLQGSESQLPYDPEPWPEALRLIDLSMFPSVYGQTRVLSNGGEVGLKNA